jgi:hypothetical protein
LVAKTHPLQVGDRDLFCQTTVEAEDGGARFIAELDKSFKAHQDRHGYTHIGRDGKETFIPPKPDLIQAENEGIPLADLERHEEIADEVRYWLPGQPIPEGYGTIPGGDRLVRVVDDEQMNDLSADDTTFALDSDALILEDDELPGPTVVTTEGLELHVGGIYVTVAGRRVVLRAGGPDQDPQYPWTSDAGYSYNNEGECFTGLNERRTGMDLAQLLGRAGYATIQELRRMAAAGLIEPPDQRVTDNPDFVRLPHPRGTSVPLARAAPGPVPVIAGPEPAARHPPPDGDPPPAAAPPGENNAGPNRPPRLARRKPGAKLPKELAGENPPVYQGADEVLLKRIRTALRALR